MENKNNTKISLSMDGIITTWEADTTDCTFEEVLKGFLGCMFAQDYIPGTEIKIFQDYITEMKDIYNNKRFE